MAEKHREVIQRQIHQDWANREYIEVIANSIKKITAFLNSFGKKLKFPVKILRKSIAQLMILIYRYVLPVSFSSFK